MHRLVARIIREHLATANQLDAVCQATADLLRARADALNDSWHRDRAAARDLTAQVIALHHAAAGCSDNEKLTRAILKLRLWAVFFLNRLGDHASRAIEIAKVLVGDYERVLGPDHPDTLGTRVSLASAYWRVGRSAEAFTLQQQNLADCERILGPDHPDTLQSRRNLTAAREADAKAREQDPD